MSATRRADSKRDPLIALRVPAALDAALRAEAKANDSSLSEIVRSALEAHLATPATPRAITRRVSDGCKHRVRPGSFCKRCERTI
jgi:hypothetical protein